jgi:hypothetical protein
VEIERRNKMKKIEYENWNGQLVKGWKVHECFAVTKVGKYWQVDHLPSKMKLGSPKVTTKKEMVSRFNNMIKAVEGTYPDFDWNHGSYNELVKYNKDDITYVFRLARNCIYDDMV